MKNLLFPVLLVCSFVTIIAHGGNFGSEILIIGGFDYGTRRNSKSVVVLDPEQSSVKPYGHDLKRSRCRAVAAFVGGKVVVAGGQPGQVEIADRDGDFVEQGPNLKSRHYNKRRTALGAVTADGQFYVTGAFVDVDSDTAYKERGYGGRARVDKFNGSTWEMVNGIIDTDLLPIHGGSAVAIGEYIYLIGSKGISRVNINDIRSANIKEVTTIKNGQYGQASVAFGNSVVICGGGTQVPTASCQQYLLDEDRFVDDFKSMNVARADHKLVVSDGKIYAIGGYRPGKKSGEKLPALEIELYDPKIGDWEYLKKASGGNVKLLSGREGPAVVSLD